jgi:hypothetical protein
VSDERRESVLRGGYTYVDDPTLELFAVRGNRPGEVELRWSDGPSGPVRLLQSSSRDFSGEVVEVAGLPGPGLTDLAPADLTFYRVER